VVLTIRSYDLKQERQPTAKQITRILVDTLLGNTVQNVTTVVDERLKE